MYNLSTKESSKRGTEKFLGAIMSIRSIKKTMKYLLGKLFGKNQEVKNFRALQAMKEEVAKVSEDGLLHFTIRTHENGWTAQCNEIEGIMTGGTSEKPSGDEIESNIREAIHAAFNIDSSVPENTIKNSENLQALYSFKNNSKQKVLA